MAAIYLGLNVLMYHTAYIQIQQYKIFFSIYKLWEWIILGKQGHYHGCWCPGSLHPQVISIHDIDSV